MHSILDHYLLTRLGGKVALGKSDGFLARIAVLGDEVTGVAGEHEVINRSFGAAAKFDHFRDATKMVRHRVTRCFEGLNGAVDRGLEVLPAGVSKRFHDVPGKPELDVLVWGALA